MKLQHLIRIFHRSISFKMFMLHECDMNAIHMKYTSKPYRFHLECITNNERTTIMRCIEIAPVVCLFVCVFVASSSIHTYTRFSTILVLTEMQSNQLQIFSLFPMYFLKICFSSKISYKQYFHHKDEKN